MNTKHLFPVVVLAVVLAVAGCNRSGKLSEPSKFTPPAGPVELKLKWPVGERVVQDTDMKTKMEVALPNQAAPMKQDMTMGQKYALTVLKADADGGHEVQMEFLSVRMGMEMGGKNMMNYDSAKKSAADAKNPMADMFSKIVGSKIRFFMDASNGVDHVEGVDEMINRLSAGGQASAVAPIKSMFSEEYFKQLMSSSRFLPTKAVSPGDTWPVKIEFPMAMLGTLVMDYAFTFQGWEMHGARNCARLEFTGTVKTKPGSTPNSTGMTITIKDGTTSGSSWFDPELGIIIETDLNQDMTMNMTLPKNPATGSGQPQNMATQMSQKLVIKLDSVK